MRPDRRLSIDQIQPWLNEVNPHFADLVPENQAEMDAKRERRRRETLELYFETVLPAVVEGLSRDKGHAAIRNRRIHTLVSLMGFSPETTVISAAVVRPEQLIVIYGVPDDDDEASKVEFSYDIALDFLTDHKILRGSRIKNCVIDPTKPTEIYTAIRKAIEQTPTINDSWSALVDITGGKKVMSATAGQAAWECRLPLLYVDGEYDANLRRPWPGTERVIQLDNPSQQEQLQMRIDALSLYSDRNFPQAVQAFDRCVANRTDERLDVLASALCRAYVRWTDLDLPKLEEEVVTVTARLNEPRVIRLFKNNHQSRDPMFERLDALRKVAHAEPLAMVASFLELAGLYCSEVFQRYDFACLLVYRAMEAMVERGLKTIAGSEFNLSDPDWHLLGDEESLAAQYVSLSQQTYSREKAEKGLPSDIRLVNGVGLLCICSNLHEAAGMRPESLIGRVRGVANMRNSSVLAHGNRTLTSSDYFKMRDEAEMIAQWILGEQCEEVKQLREKLSPIDLESLHDPTQY